jgi:hypothetical protein
VIVDGSEYCGYKGKEGIQGENGDTLYWCKKFEGDAPDIFEAMVIPQYPANDCWVEEKVNSDFVEITNECQNLVISAGQGDACTITNTVFFEGIPILSRYSQLLMLLILLGFGGLAIRRLTSFQAND